MSTKTHPARWLWRLIAVGLILAGAGILACGGDTPRGAVHVSRLADDIGPVSANFIDRAIDRAEEADAKLWVLQLDTPGGLISSTDDIVQRILAADIPVAVFVSPAGARAASAGTFITMAAHIAAMAPNTQIGAAHPVAGGGDDIEGDLNEKITNDAAADIRGIAKHRGRNEEWAEDAVRNSVSITGDEAVELNVVDLTADDLDAFLEAVDGREVRLAPNLPPIVLDIADAPRVETNYSLSESILDVIADPNIAFILINIGGLLLIVEAFSPGLVGPGVFGVIMLIVGFFALGPLDTNPAGIALLVLAFILIVAEVFVAGFGFLGIGGIVALIMGGLILIGDPEIDAEEVSLWAVAAVAGFIVVVGGGVLMLVGWDRRRPKWRYEPESKLIGAEGVAHNDIGPTGTAVVQAELWSARSHDGRRIPEGTPLRVVAMDGLTTVVEATVPLDQDGGTSEPSEPAMGGTSATRR